MKRKSRRKIEKERKEKNGVTYYLLLLRLLLFLLNLIVLPFSADVHVLAILVTDRSTLAAEDLTWPEPDRWPRILVPGRWIDVST